MHKLNIANSLLKNKAPRQSEGTNEVLTGISLPKKGCGSPAPVQNLATGTGETKKPPAYQSDC